LTVSVGVAGSEQQHTTPEALLHAADLALYAAKREGRNRVAVATATTPRVI
jgi:diguanylate cyclase (GGDEF)-like protein